MSLVNLSHVCSHLQNASLARLGLTSIPYSRLHLQLSLLLLKQGFISQLKLGGPSPPASCFPPGLRDNNNNTSHPHIERDYKGPDSALQRMVADGWSAQRLREEGFGDEDVEFAVSRRLKNKEQLEKDGWDDVAIDFLVRHMWPQQRDHPGDFNEDNILTFPRETLQTPEQLAEEGLSPADIEIVQQNQDLFTTAWQEISRYYPDEAAQARPQGSPHFRSLLKLTGLPQTTLAHFAGPRHRYRTERDLARDGLELDAMGLTIPNQTFQPPPPDPALADPLGLEAEGTVTQANVASRRLWLGLKYWDGLPVLSKARMISKPTKRFFLSAREIGDLCRGRAATKGQIRPMSRVGEIMAVTTDLGVLEARECVERRTGGMVLCRIW